MKNKDNTRIVEIKNRLDSCVLKMSFVTENYLGQKVDNASLAGFSVSFIWLGSGSDPGSQPYEIYNENYDIVEQGMTIVQSPSSVPEPGTMTLACLGLISLVYVKRIQNI